MILPSLQRAGGQQKACFGAQATSDTQCPGKDARQALIE